jgi:hypothetical protein
VPKSDTETSKLGVLSRNLDYENRFYSVFSQEIFTKTPLSAEKTDFVSKEIMVAQSNEKAI